MQNHPPDGFVQSKLVPEEASNRPRFISTLQTFKQCGYIKKPVKGPQDAHKVLV